MDAVTVRLSYADGAGMVIRLSRVPNVGESVAFGWDQNIPAQAFEVLAVQHLAESMPEDPESLEKGQRPDYVAILQVRKSVLA
ncbi:hypothetical protein [Undibacterium sp.]|uniref:hypothetical protein n=1 Tax=Undibacterium sp. TaxID=1914977 RepID=UPI00374D9DE7